jgi:predicted SAM-dependent methyltransferase
MQIVGVYQLKLHIGGKQKREGWKILNIQPGENVDYIGDISNLNQFPEGSCDQVYASHVLEHVRQQDIPQTLAGIYRILEPGGQLLVSVPDWDVLCHLFINPKAPLTVKWHALRIMLGGQIDANDYHYCGFNQELLFKFLQEAGFKNMSRVESFGLFNDTSNFAPYGFPISLNASATK